MMSDHVKAWEKAKGNQKREQALIRQWDAVIWQIDAFGRTWEGPLTDINTDCDVFFTVQVVDPADANRTVLVKAPFEQFRQKGQQ